MDSGKTLLIIGATGLVGRALLELMQNDPRVTNIVAPTRRPLPGHPKLNNPIVDYDSLPDADWWAADAALCTLGTTLKQAGSKEHFTAIDYGYVMAAARKTRRTGTSCFVLNSSLGANMRSSNFYLASKGRLESDLEKLGFLTVVHVRPSLLDGGKRPERRIAEEIGLAVGNAVSVLIPKKYKPVSTRNVARAMLDAAIEAKPGRHVIESEELHY